MKNFKKKALNSRNGITLISLVITIIVDLVSYDRNRKYRILADSPIIGINL